MKTYQPSAKDIKRNWYIFDAKDQILGRFASQVAQKLIGKHKVDYAPNLDMGDIVVVINAKDIRVTGRKEKQKVYYKHSGYPGGFREIKYKKLLKENPARIIELAVKRMLPANRLQKRRLSRLKVFADEKHTFAKVNFVNKNKKINK